MPFSNKKRRTTRYARMVILITLTLLIAPPIVNRANATPTYAYGGRQWGSLGGPSTPNGVAVDIQGNVYITDACPYNGPNCAIGKMTNNGTFLTMWGTRGTGPGQFNNPQGIAIDTNNQVFVTDSQNNNIQKFSSTGTLLASWNSNGTSNGQLHTPLGIAVNSTGHVYVVDSGHQRIGIFRNDGSFVKYFQLGTPGNFVSPFGIAVDPQGFVYVDDPTTAANDNFAGNITKFTKNGLFVSTWEGALNPQGLAVDNASNIYVADNAGTISRVQVYNTNTGKLLQTFGNTNPGKLNYPTNVAIDSQGNVFVSDLANFNVQKYTSNGLYVSTLSYQRPGKLYTPYGAALDGLGNIYIADEGNDRVQKFKINGSYLTSWGSPGNATGQFDGPAGVTVDHNNYVYVTDSGNNRVQKFYPNGTFIKTWGSLGNCLVGCLNGQFYYPFGIAADNSNNVYVTDTQNNRVQKFDSQGNFILKWTSNGSGQLSYPEGITVDSSGNVYVSDTGNNKIEKFTSTGTILASWGSPGTGNGQFNSPGDIALDSAGNIFIADTFNNRVQELAPNGSFLTTFGTQGSGDGQLNGPIGVAVDNSDSVYIVDTNIAQTGALNNRVEVFTPIDDVATTGIVLSRNTAYTNITLVHPVQVNITVSNLGLSQETFWVKALANSTIIGQQNITLAPGLSSLVSLTWTPNTQSRRVYLITAQVQEVTGDPNTANNMIQAGLFQVRIRGDVNGDCTANGIDLALLGASFLSTPATSGWKSNVDMNNDGTVNGIDLAILGSAFTASC